MRIALALLPALFVVACSQKKEAPPPPAVAEADAGVALTAAAGRGGEDVQPVYPIDPKAPPVPIAQTLCEILHAMPETKRASCCNARPGITMAGECTRTLSAAIRSKAVTVSEDDVAACAAAWDKVLDGCDWVGPFAPTPPSECRGVVKGALASGATCRSSLECDGSLRCLGVGPTTPGKCGPAKADGDTCGGTVDTLAAFTRDGDLDKQHPECANACVRHKCGVGKAQAPVTRTARKASGEACTKDFECRGGCVKGACAPRCDLR